jgi:hypothetical protein
LLPLLSGCVIFSSDEGDLQEELDIHRALWEGAAITDYGMRFQRRCLNCATVFLVPVHITVSDGAINEVTDVDTGQPAAPEVVATLRTIDELFAFIQTAIDQNAVEIDINYEHVLGYPMRVTIDLSRSLINDNDDIEISEFEDLS